MKRRLKNLIREILRDTTIFHWTSILWYPFVVLAITVGLIGYFVKGIINLFKNWYFILYGYRTEDDEWLADWVKTFDRNTKHLTEDQRWKKLKTWVKMRNKIEQYLHKPSH